MKRHGANDRVDAGTPADPNQDVLVEAALQIPRAQVAQAAQQRLVVRRCMCEHHRILQAEETAKLRLTFGVGL